MSAPRDPDAAGLEPSLVRYGPFYTLCARLGMTLDGSRGAMRAAIVATAVTWLPLVALAFVQGLAWRGRTAGPLLTDPAVWARLVVGLPMLLLVSPMIAARTRPVLEELRRLVPDARKAEFDAVRQRSSQLDHAALPELILIGISVVTGWLGVHATVAATGDWRTLPETGHLSLAGVWAAAVSLPIFQFIVLRWLWRIFLWWRFLAGVAGMDLQLIPTHPDGFGGLGFLGEAQSACFLLASPFALIFAAHLAKAVQHGGDLRSFQAPAIAFVILCAILLMGPALSLSGALIRARRRGIFEYGRLGQAYVSQFDRKWVRGGAGDEPLLGTGDIQSLADISNSMKVVRELKPIPYERRHFLLFAVCILVPAIPPLLLVMPLSDILGKVAAILVK